MSTGSAASHLPDIERRRLRALADGDVATAAPLHAEDYQLITPNGSAMTRDDYLGDVESGRRAGAAIVAGVLTGASSRADLERAGAPLILGAIADILPHITE